ncbi:ionotropic receptor 93a-like [Cloeon dipterum]|uniref:ionotropic receptor 93a-like n=1 Tax=Cloeon dipterum TaxID=197152 RepID=UPI00321F77D3
MKQIFKAISEAQPKVRFVSPQMQMLDLGYFSSYDMVRQTIAEFPNLSSIEHFLVITGRENIFIVMKIAKSLRLVNPSTQWLYVLPETQYYSLTNDSRIISLLHEGDNVAFLINATRHSSETNSCSEGGILCYSRELLRALVASLASYATTEQIALKRVAKDEWEEEKLSVSERREILLKHITAGIAKNLGETCDGCMAWKMRSAITWGLKGPTGPSGDEEASMIESGIWQPGTGVELYDPLFTHIKHGFRGKQLTIVSCHAPPWHEIQFDDQGQVVKYSGFIFDIVNELSSRLNFTFSYKVVFPANTVKGFVAEGREPTLDDAVADERSPIWDNMIDLVQQNHVFMAATAMSMSAGRESRVRFTLAVASQPHTFLVAKPRQMSRTLLFLSPFTGKTWLAIFGSTLLVGPALYFIHKASPATELGRGLRPKNVGPKKGGLNRIMNCIWYMYGALMQQGAVQLPTADSGRLVFGIWWIFVMVIVTSYCGNLVAFLTFPRMNPAVTTLGGLLKLRGTMTWGLMRGSELEKLLEDSSVPEFNYLLNKAERHAVVDDALLERVAYDRHVLLERRSRLLILQSLQLKKAGYCSFALATDDFLPEQIGLAMPIQSPYTNLVNKEIRRMQQAGLIDSWFRHAMPRRDRCWVTPQSLATEVNSHSVNLDDMQGSFIVLGIGLVAAFLAAILERCFRCLSIMKARGIIEPFVN